MIEPEPECRVDPGIKRGGILPAGKLKGLQRFQNGLTLRPGKVKQRFIGVKKQITESGHESSSLQGFVFLLPVFFRDVSRQSEEKGTFFQGEVAKMMLLLPFAAGIDNDIALLIPPLQNGLTESDPHDPVPRLDDGVKVEQVGVPKGEGVTVP